MSLRAAAVVAVALGGALCGGCGGGEDPPHYGNLDGQVAKQDRGKDLVPWADLYSPMRDGALDIRAGETGCQLGTADNCTTCGDVCPPGKDDTGTTRVCLSAACVIQCNAEYYDVNGALSDGCEAQDDLPLHETLSAASFMGKVEDGDSAVTRTGLLPSDSRTHVTAPATRENGREDWWSLHIEDTTFNVVEAKITASFASLPTKARFTVYAYYKCDSGSTLTPITQSGYGGSTLAVQPSTSCSFLGDDSGTLYVKLAKDSGPHSGTSYGLSIEP